MEIWRNEGSPSFSRNLIKKMCIKISFEGGVAGTLFNYSANADAGRVVDFDIHHTDFHADYLIIMA
jgi:hypothetical protein